MNTKSRLSEVKRQLSIDVDEHNAFFLWGPRKVGKTTYLKQAFPQAKYYDLLDPKLVTYLSIHPGTLKEEITAANYPLVVIDEVQKVPKLLDEVHWCVENTQTKFILCGSSVLKLKRDAANLLGGRAWRYEMFPFTTVELPEFDLLRALNHGLIPQHYFSNKPEKFFQGYILDYLNEEIRAEAKLQHLDVFSLFLESVAANHGQLINYANIGRQCGVSGKTARAYYQILQDTLLGYRLSPWTKSKKYRLIETEKFYLFDPGLALALQGGRVMPKTAEFGRLFEHFILNEIRTYLSYSEKNYPISYWRTSTNLEVDIIVGDLNLCIEVKSSEHVHEQDLKGLKALKEEHSVENAVVVSQAQNKRLLQNGILVLPWQDFCQQLWQGEFI